MTRVDDTSAACDAAGMRGDPMISSKSHLAMLLALCVPLLALAEAVTREPDTILLPASLRAGEDFVMVLERTTSGPVINGVPDPSVAYSARVMLGETRVDLYGCGPTPSAAVASLARDISRQIENLAYQTRAQAET